MVDAHTGSRAAANAASLQAKKGASKKKQLNTADHRSGRSGKSDVGEVKKFQGKSVKDLGF
eukprot:CAMPEP_0198467260 /NCGR_PEP_ID=MMETSP1456-20131121/4558_1 /TAXON_ID=1461544 ORGANISM="Unidentified sp., Strain RCC1871" /NCGR_SAMPLE_ID=MMETSP1456 /ASSEMBLY_ACC=CAM_ASM_001119 /LENGTH=60 /DNA_ID=CAMNT_0044193271 /DNA_START=108 /DNA_END=290 /DNA_ORIENTATION=+